MNTADIAKMSPEQILALIHSLKSAPSKLTCKVTEKGGVSVYGLGRFPVTLYRSQWERLLSHADQIKAFITANASSLATKD